MTILKRAGRGLAAGVAGALVLGTTALVAAPAQAADATGELKWTISQQFVDHLFFSKMGTLPVTPTGSVSEGATHYAGDVTVSTDDYFTFPAESVTTDASGTQTARFTGTVRGAFVAGVEQYSVTVSDPVVVREADGDGSIKATVTGKVGAAGTPTPATEVTVAEFSGATTTDGVTSVTPNWLGVLAAGSERATALNITNPAHLDGGRSFHPDFLGALAPGTLAHFHNSSATAAQDHKRPGAFSYSADPVLTPSITSSVLSASYEDGISIKAEGTGFTAVTNPGDAGVYVALAPADMVIDYSDRGAMEAMAAVDYITPGRFNGNAFTAVLNAPTEKLVAGTDYAIFTWQAHTHSNTTQDTKTPVAIDWAKLEKPADPVKPTEPPVKKPVVKKASKSTVKVTKKATRKKTGTVKITVAGGATKATGKVKVVIKAPGKKAVTKKVTLKKGKATVKLGKAKKKGTYKVTVTYSGDSKLKAAKKKVAKFKVKK